jgi:hypothetical protein
VKLKGIPLENARLAIRMAQIKPIMSEAQKALPACPCAINDNFAAVKA